MKGNGTKVWFFRHRHRKVFVGNRPKNCFVKGERETRRLNAGTTRKTKWTAGKKEDETKRVSQRGIGKRLKEKKEDRSEARKGNQGAYSGQKSTLTR